MRHVQQAPAAPEVQGRGTARPRLLGKGAQRTRPLPAPWTKAQASWRYGYRPADATRRCKPALGADQIAGFLHKMGSQGYGISLLDLSAKASGHLREASGASRGEQALACG